MQTNLTKNLGLKMFCLAAMLVAILVTLFGMLGVLNLFFDILSGKIIDLGLVGATGLFLFAGYAYFWISLVLYATSLDY